MKVAICGNPPPTLNMQAFLLQNGIEVKFLIRDFIINGVWAGSSLPEISFFEFRLLINAGELDGVIISKSFFTKAFTKKIIQMCKFYEIPRIGVIDPNRRADLDEPIFWLDQKKYFIPQLEANIIHACDLNCKACMHFGPLFTKKDIYPLDNFQRDIERLAQVCEIDFFCLLGGEPLLLKNLDEYIKISRQYMPKTVIYLVTNALRIPSIEQKILDAIRENNLYVAITKYPPTARILDKVNAVLDSNGILHSVTNDLSDPSCGQFLSVLTLHGGNNPYKSRVACTADACRSLRPDGKIYKCALDAYHFKFVEKFGIENFPKGTGVDIYSPIFASLLDSLDDNVELCYWCSEQARKIPWQPTNNPKLEDWLADPDELKNFL